MGLRYICSIVKLLLGYVVSAGGGCMSVRKIV